MKVGGIELSGHPRFEPYHLFVGAVPYMVDQARYAANVHAHSYRGFLVGATVFAIQPATQETVMLSAGNLKAKKGKEKVCAEKNALNQAENAGFTQALGIVVVGTTDRKLIGEVNELASPTLYPCDDCLGLFHGHSQMRDDTIVVTTGLEEDIFEVHTYRELHDMVMGIGDQPEEKVRYGFNNWSLRLAEYDRLATTEMQRRPELRRTEAMLAQIAMTVPLIG